MDARKILLVAVAAVAIALVVPAGASAKVVWLCKPGMRANPCEPSLTTTVYSPSGKRLGVQHVQRAKRRRADCFYVYPTVSDQRRPQATQVVDDVLRSVALQQAARYSRDCRVFAPVYRQVTIQGLLNPDTVTQEMRDELYADVREAWRTYLRRYNHGRGVIFVSHSQGSFVLRELIAKEVDPKPAARRRIISAILLGGNVTVRKGGDRGGDFQHVRACRSRNQLGCVIAFSTYNETPPANSLFGRTDIKLPLAPAARPGTEVLCTNPAALVGGAGQLSPVYATKPFAASVIGSQANGALAALPHPRTPWATFPHGVTGRCSRAGGADVLRIDALNKGFEPTPLPDATWGLHLVDANVALGNLADLVRHQISLYERR
jgi:hypothetical protein